MSVKYKPGLHPNSRKNLKPFLPGHNGNPHPGYALATNLKDSLRKPLIKPAEDAPAGDHLVYATLKGAIDLVPTPFREAWDRTEGKVTDTHEIKGEIILRIIDDDS